MKSCFVVHTTLTKGQNTRSSRLYDMQVKLSDTMFLEQESQNYYNLNANEVRPYKLRAHNDYSWMKQNPPRPNA